MPVTCTQKGDAATSEAVTAPQAATMAHPNMIRFHIIASPLQALDGFRHKREEKGTAEGLRCTVAKDGSGSAKIKGGTEDKSGNHEGQPAELPACRHGLLLQDLQRVKDGQHDRLCEI